MRVRVGAAVVVRTGVGVGFAVVVAGLVVVATGLVEVATGLVAVAAGVVVAGFVVVGAAVVAAGVVAVGDVEIDFAMIVVLVAAVDWVALLDGSCVACVRAGITPAGFVAPPATVGRVVAAATFGALLLCEDAVFTVASSVGVQAGSFVASSLPRAGIATDESAAPPAMVTAPADSGPLNSWIMPIMPVRMNVVMSHNCQRLARTPMRKLPQ